ncbi:MAG: glycosyltransferase [bacterium]|nr:glycosyltransferase [bacterium]
MRKIKVLHIINSLDIGGNERFLLQLLEHLPRETFSQEVCVPDRGKDATRDLEAACQRLGTPIKVLRVGGNWDVSVLPRLIRVILRGHFDVVHTHLIYSQVYGRLAAAAARTRCIVSSEQNVYDFKARPPFSWVERRLSRWTDRVIACSNKVREHLIEKVGVNPLRVVVVPNGVDTDVFFPIKKRTRLYRSVENVRKQLGIEEGDTVIGTVGHMTRQKGYDVLVAAIPRILRKHPRAKFVFVGRGLLRGRIEKQARALGVEQRSRFAGIRPDISVVLNCFDVFVLPSLWEGFGTAIIEAMACGVPVVASRVGGIPEIVEDGMNGLLVPPGRPGPLAEAVILMLDQPSMRREIARVGRTSVTERFSVRKMAQTVGKVYLQLARRSSPPRKEVSEWRDTRVISTTAWRG